MPDPIVDAGNTAASVIDKISDVRNLAAAGRETMQKLPSKLGISGMGNSVSQKNKGQEGVGRKCFIKTPKEERSFFLFPRFIYLFIFSLFLLVGG